MSEKSATPPAETAPTPGAQTIRASELVETPPEPSAHVVNRPASETPAATPQPATPPAATPEKASGPILAPKTDRRGVAFDPEKHLDRIHPVSGNWMPKKPKRPATVSQLGSARHEPKRSTVAPDHGSAAPAGNGVAGSEAPKPDIEAGLPTDQYKGAALGACTTLYAVGMTLGGDEWRPSEDEHGNLMQCFEAYFRAKGITDISPGWALTIAVVAYAGPRFRQPKTVSTLQKVGGFFQRIGLWWRSRSVVKKIPTE